MKIIFTFLLSFLLNTCIFGFTLTADFTYQYDCTKDRCEFYDQSSGEDTIVSWAWYHGNTNISLSQNPKYDFNDSTGKTNIEKQITLIVTDKKGNKDTTIKTIVVWPSLHAGFQASKFALGVNFKNTTFHLTEANKDIINYTYDFGDSTISNDPDVFHTYSTAGSKKVCLTAEYGIGCESTSCDNLTISPPAACNGFEVGATGWNAYIGSSVFCCEDQTGFTADRFTLNSSGNDSCTGISKTAPAMGASARMGDNEGTFFAESLRHSFHVSINDTAFTYWFALVMEPDLTSPHQANKSPYFEAMLIDGVGDTIPNTYQFYTDAGLDSATCPFGNLVVYKDWTSVSVNLSAYVGQTVSIQFKNSDCNSGNHLAYAYVDISCGGPSALDEVTVKAKEFNLSPNPSYSGIFTLNKNEELKGILEVYTLLGERIFKSTLNNSSIIDLSAQPAGQYFVRFIDGDEVFTQKVMIVN